jgi:hypothetical protein
MMLLIEACSHPYLIRRSHIRTYILLLYVYIDEGFYNNIGLLAGTLKEGYAGLARPYYYGKDSFGTILVLTIEEPCTLLPEQLSGHSVTTCIGAAILSSYCTYTNSNKTNININSFIIMILL